MRREVLDQILADRVQGRAAVVATRLATGQQTVLHPDEPGQPPEVEPEVWAAARAALANDRSERVGDVFLHVHNAPLRLLIGSHPDMTQEKDLPAESSGRRMVPTWQGSPMDADSSELQHWIDRLKAGDSSARKDWERLGERCSGHRGVVRYAT